MKYNFDHISFTDVMGHSILKESPLQTDREGVSAKDSESSPLLPSYTEKYVDAILGQSTGISLKRDSITDFYSDLKDQKGALQSTRKGNESKRTLAINKNTADRHGRT